MKKLLYTYIILCVALLAACSGSSDGVKIDARFLNMNQATFYVYSPDGAITGIDTITVFGGRFTYERGLSHDGTLVIVFPNFSEMPVFVSSGNSINIEANAAKLREMEVTGTKENEEFTEWRKDMSGRSPAEMKKTAETYIHDHPASPASQWLLRKYFILAPESDIAKAQELVKLMKAADAENLQLTRQEREAMSLKPIKIGGRLPSFSAKDIDGNVVTDKDLAKGDALLFVWESWNYESYSVLRLLSDAKDDEGAMKFDKVVTICLDPDVKQCRTTLKNNRFESFTTVCDGMMWESPVVKALGVNSGVFNVRLKDGKITKFCTTPKDLLKR